MYIKSQRMRVLILLILFGESKAQIWEHYYKQHGRNQDLFYECGYSEDVTLSFRKATYSFALHTFRKLAFESNSHFAFSPLAVWQSLAAIAEGTEGIARTELFNILGLPEDGCVRRRYYELAGTRLQSGLNLKLAQNNLFVVDDHLKLNDDWKNFALTQLQLDTIAVPIRAKPKEAAFVIRQAISSQLTSLNIQGNSVLLNSIDFKGLWTEAFSDAGIYRAPFYNTAGERIGSVDMMRTKKRVKMAYIQRINAKILELPVGDDGRFRMFFLVPLGDNLLRSIEPLNPDIIVAILDSLRESTISIHVRIPRFVMETEWDVKNVMDYIGISKLWTDATATRNISKPPALPSSFIQRVSIVSDKHGTKRVFNDLPTRNSSDFLEDTGLHPILGNEFTADRPFILGLFDVDILTCILSAAFTTPTFK